MGISEMFTIETGTALSGLRFTGDVADDFADEETPAFDCDSFDMFETGEVGLLLDTSIPNEHCQNTSE